MYHITKVSQLKGSNVEGLEQNGSGLKRVLKQRKGLRLKTGKQWLNVKGRYRKKKIKQLGNKQCPSSFQCLN